MVMETADSLPYQVSVNGEVLAIQIRRDFDVTSLHQDWAHSLHLRYPGPFVEIQIDLSSCGPVSSTFFAGLVQLHHRYAPQGGRLVLLKPDRRLERNLHMLRLDKMFSVVSR